MKLAYGPIVEPMPADREADEREQLRQAADPAALARMQRLVDEAVARADAERAKALRARYGYRAARRARRAG